MILNIGCGHKIPAEYAGDTNIVSVDRVAMSGVNVVHDLNVLPWPWPDNAFDMIMAFDVIEHLDNVVPVMDECWRILRARGRMVIRTTAWDCRQSYTDPTHKHWFTLESFDFFDPDTAWGGKYCWYTARKWHKVEGYQDASELMFTMEVRK